MPTLPLDEVRMHTSRPRSSPVLHGPQDRAVSLASAVKAAGSGDAAPLEQLQHQQDEQLELDERSWDSVMDSFTQVCVWVGGVGGWGGG